MKAPEKIDVISFYDLLFQVGLQKMATEHTRLIYVTTGVLLGKLVQTKSLTEYTHIFVDEVHKHEVYVVKSIKVIIF